jgi:hypothetical protein
MRLSLLTLTFSLLFGCIAQPMVDTDHKLDSALRLAIMQSGARDTEATAEFSVFVRTQGEADREVLTEAGLKVQTIAGDIATAVGTAEAIRRATALGAVLHVSLSGTDYPQGPARAFHP